MSFEPYHNCAKFEFDKMKYFNHCIQKKNNNNNYVLSAYCFKGACWTGGNMVKRDIALLSFC